MDNNVSSTGKIQNKQKVKYRIGLVMTFILLYIALLFDAVELILDAVGTGGAFVLVIIGVIKDFAAIFFFPIVFFALRAPFWRGRKAKKKMIAMVTGYIVAAIPWIGAVLPETFIAVAVTIYLTRAEDKSLSQEKAVTSLRSNAITRMKRFRPTISKSESTNPDESSKVTRLRRSPALRENPQIDSGVIAGRAVPRRTPLGSKFNLSGQPELARLRNNPNVGLVSRSDSVTSSGSTNNPVSVTNSGSVNIPRSVKTSDSVIRSASVASSRSTNISGSTPTPLPTPPPNSASTSGPNVLPNIVVPNNQEPFPQDIVDSSNYQGDWTQLMRERMMNPEIKERFMKTRAEAIPSMKTGIVPEVGNPLTSKIIIEKPKSYASHYEDQMRDYDSNVGKVFASTKIGDAASHNSQGTSLGVSKNIGDTGAVFDDANKKGVPLTNRQKNIIEAHEKGHGLRDYTAPTDGTEFRQSLDLTQIPSVNRTQTYLSKPEEVAERMAQLKNYFGFKGAEVFTKNHLRLARENYVKDTGLDNNMTDFFASITPETEEKFLSTINKHAL